MGMISAKKDLDMQSNNKPFVAIYMITYNHESYIAQAVESIMIQQTNFEYKLFIGEDCSTDQTSEICKSLKGKYPNKIELFLNKKNLGVPLNAKQIYKACFESGAKYIAMLEGDDYWTDSYKLQKQVDFLEANLDYVLVGSYANTHKGNKVETPKNIEFQNFDFHDTARGIPIPTLTYCFRNLLNYENLIYPVGDMGLLFEVSKNGGKMGKLPFVSGVYNYHGGGLNSGNSRFDNKKLQVETLYLMGKRTDDYFFKFIIRWGFLKFIIRELKAILLFRRKNYNTFFLAVIYFLKK